MFNTYEVRSSAIVNHAFFKFNRFIFCAVFVISKWNYLSNLLVVQQEKEIAVIVDDSKLAFIEE